MNGFARMLALLMAASAMNEGVSEAKEGMGLPGSPGCRVDVSSRDVLDWVDYSHTQVPPVEAISSSSRDVKVAHLEKELARNRYITAAYLSLCRDRVLDNGTCTDEPDAGFLWACAAARGSATAGQYMEEGLSAYRTDTRKGASWVDRTIGNQGILPAVAVLGKANGKIFDHIGWQHFAAAKCGNDYVVELLGRSNLKDKAEFQDYWRRVKRDKAGSVVVGTMTEKLLAQEQALIQPDMAANRTLLGVLSRASLVSSGVYGAKGFRQYAEEDLGVTAMRVNLADYNQRFRWERDHVVPKILERVLSPGCGGMRALDSLADIIREKQNLAADRNPSLAGYPRVKSGGELRELRALSGANATLAATDH